MVKKSEGGVDAVVRVGFYGFNEGLLVKRTRHLRGGRRNDHQKVFVVGDSSDGTCHVCVYREQLSFENSNHEF